MLVFIDESGYPHPNDPNEKSVLAALCIPREVSRNLSSAIYNLKRDIFGVTDPSRLELHAATMLNHPTIRRAAAGNKAATKVANLIDGVFEVLDNWQFANLMIFAIVMDRPPFVPATPPGFMPKQTYFLLQRVQRHMETKYPDRLAHIIFDETDLGHDRKLAVAFTKFLYSQQGRGFDRILETALFVSSMITPGSQIADFVAGCIRHWHQGNLSKAPAFPYDPFVGSVKKWYAAVTRRTKNFEDVAENVDLWGIYKMGIDSFPHPGP